MWKIYSLTKSANFLIIVLRAEFVTTFGSKMVTISARNTNFGILLLLKDSFREFFFYWLDQTLVYNANCPLLRLARAPWISGT